MKRKKKGWFALVGVSILAVFLVWSLAFLLWLFWPELKERFWSEATKSVVNEKKGEARERISEGERKQLDNILKRRQ
jgi:hypothetical protein